MEKYCARIIVVNEKFVFIYFILFLIVIEIRCGPPQLVGNTTHQVDRDGLHVYYKCLPNYIHERGELIAVCSENGTWLGEDPICVGKCTTVTIQRL